MVKSSKDSDERSDGNMNIQILHLVEGAKFFDSTQSEVFPEEYFHMCTKRDCFDFVMKLKRPEHKVPFMIKEKL